MARRKSGDPDKLHDPDGPPAPAQQTWVALALIIVLVVGLVVLLTVFGVGPASA